MCSHSSRTACYVVGGEGLVPEPEYLSQEQPEAAATVVISRAPEPTFKFGRMFPSGQQLSAAERETMIAELIKMGQRMNEVREEEPPADSRIPSGYTYLGQFIAHEVTFDKTKAPLTDGPIPPAYRSPQIDLDSLYGRGPKEEPQFYQDSARLKVGETLIGNDVRIRLLHDLPRAGYGEEKPGLPLIPDQRNDENLALSQTHLAFIRFHNGVVDELYAKGCPTDQLFETARKEVVQHFQAIILEDYLPTLLDKPVLESVRSGELQFFDTEGKEGVFMPLEFAVAAFRFGHSMVRDKYEWNYAQCSEPGRNGAARLSSLFSFTNFSGNLGDAPRLTSDWVIDWRRFYDFRGLGLPDDQRAFNKARKIDTVFSLHIENIPGYPHITDQTGQRSIAVRNLLRGFSLNLPTGEKVADCIQSKRPLTRLTQDQIATGSEALSGKTPLWYYVLKEAELNNGRLGQLASYIIAETLVGLIKKSPYSILNDPKWLTKFGRRAKMTKTRRYEMTDLLAYADVLDPVGEHMKL